MTTRMTTHHEAGSGPGVGRHPGCPARPVAAVGAASLGLLAAGLGLAASELLQEIVEHVAHRLTMLPPTEALHRPAKRGEDRLGQLVGSHRGRARRLEPECCRTARGARHGRVGSSGGTSPPTRGKTARHPRGSARTARPTTQAGRASGGSGAGSARHRGLITPSPSATRRRYPPAVWSFEGRHPALRALDHRPPGLVLAQYVVGAARSSEGGAGLRGRPDQAGWRSSSPSGSVSSASSTSASSVVRVAQVLDRRGRCGHGLR